VNLQTTNPIWGDVRHREVAAKRVTTASSTGDDGRGHARTGAQDCTNAGPKSLVESSCRHSRGSTPAT